MRRVSRRELLYGAAGLAAGYWAGRWLPDLGATVLADTSEVPSVVVVEGSNEDSPELLLRAVLAPLGGIERFVKPGQTVCIKPNATWANKPHTASSTDPDLLRALIDMVKAAGARRIVIVDRCTIDPPALCLAESGLGKVLDETGVDRELLDAYKEPPSKYVQVPVPGGKDFKSIGVIKEAVEADVRINMAVAKTHLVLPVTLCCKHMMGFLENPGGLHVSLDQGIADICTAPAIKPALHILEAIRVRVRGPSYGDGTDITDPSRVKRHNKLLAGTDPALIDAYAVLNFFGRTPLEITHIKRALETNVGEIDVERAMAAGRLRSFRPSEALRPTRTPTPTITPEVAPTESLLTPTPRRTVVPATPLPSAQASGEAVIDVGPLLNGVLVPLAAVVGGVGVVVGRRMAGNLRPPAAAGPEPADEGGPAPAPADGSEARPARSRARRGKTNEGGKEP